MDGTNRLSKTIVLAGVLLASLLALMLIGAGASPASQLDQETLTLKAITEAQASGLMGAPEAQRFVQMSLAEWAKLTDAELGQDAAEFGLTPDMPVFVLAMRGDVEWQGVGPLRPDQSSPERFDNITVVLNARTGELIWVGVYRPGFPMPVSIP